MAALLGATATLLLTAIKSARDEQRDLCDMLGDKLLKAADTASEYWLIGSNDAGHDLLEAKLLGAQAYLSSYKVLASSWFSLRDLDVVEGLFADFYDAMTGGDFRVKGRAPEPTRAQNCQVIAAGLAVTIREANLKSLRLSTMALRTARWYTVVDRLRRAWDTPKPWLSDQI